MKMSTIVSGIALAVATSGSLSARANMLFDGSLAVTAQQLAADPTLMYADGLIHASLATHANVLTGWTLGGASIDVVPNTYWESTKGAFSIDLVGTTGIGSITQTVSGLIPGNTYELSFDFTVNPSEGGHGGESTFVKWMEVDATNTSVPKFYFSGTPSATQTAANMEYVRRAIDFTATGTSTTITFAALFPSGLPATFTDGTPVSANALYTGPVIDNVDLEDITQGGVAPVATPEPASLSVLAIGGVMLLRRRR